MELVEFAEALGVPPLGLLTEYLAQRSAGSFPKARRTKNVQSKKGSLVGCPSHL
ncbi:hypothetical protein [Solilutibacter pythonis]|uniref:hypothetical protein n=1 Tax=Solilutibacter pythonis TaxID=2483112 RepID=UPI001FEB9D24|nr:hypothetical protein [Lysobacter pythonis]